MIKTYSSIDEEAMFIPTKIIDLPKRKQRARKNLDLKKKFKENFGKVIIYASYTYFQKFKISS